VKPKYTCRTIFVNSTSLVRHAHQQAYQPVFVPHVLIRKLFSIVIHKLERSTNFWLSNPFGLLRNSLAFQSCFFFAEVHDDGETGEDEKHACFECQGLRLQVSQEFYEARTSEKCLPEWNLQYPQSMSRFCFLDGFESLEGRGVGEVALGTAYE
jgi:hypothetical protein